MLLCAQVAVAEVSQQDVAKFFLSYIQVLKSGDNLEALNYWSLLDRTNADQLQIRYANTPNKLEGGSALLHYLGQLKSGVAKLDIDTITMNRGFAKINYRITTKDTSIAGAHFAVTTTTVEPSLTTPLRVFTESWDQAEGRFVNLTYRDPSLFERGNLETADQFIERTAKTLGISKEKMDRLETVKVKMFLCESYGEVQQVTGKSALGDFMKPLDAVVSRYFPAYHEIAEFLVAYANDSLPLYTLPFIEQGTATFLGGRWGRSGPVVLSLGSYIYCQNLMELDKLYSSADFSSYENNSDFSYPVAGLFCKFLYDKLGNEKYFELYRRLSGSEENVRAITPSTFKESVSAAVGIKWPALEAEFKEYAKVESYAGIAAGALDRGKLVFESGLTNCLVRVLEDSTHYNFLIQIKSGEPKAALIAEGATGAADPYRSFLFEEYFPGLKYDHQSWGLIFSSKEVGTYDFYTNVITGKYISGFTAAEEIAKPGMKQYRFRVEKQLMQDFGKRNVKLIPMK
jgi:hypothetical protein